MNYKISKEAENDLENIWLYTFEEWSENQADYYLDLIFDEFEYLSRYPQSGKDYGHVRKGYLKSRVKAHFIFYRLNLKEDQIEIIRILHQQLDLDSHL